ncbi:MAG: hypothetical protein VCD00_15640 [Candidatus Hydrogenedentota bacterium]
MGVVQNVIPLIDDLPLSEIRKRDIQSLLAPITLRAPYQSNKTLAMIRKIYIWALSEDLVEASPCMGLKNPHIGETKGKTQNGCMSRLAELLGLVEIIDSTAATELRNFTQRNK